MKLLTLVNGQLRKALAILSMITLATSSFASGTLFFSEYIEGSSNNKALEIFNGSDTAADLSQYSIELYSNGGTNAGNTLQLSDAMAILSPGNTLVIANASASADILGVAHITSNVTWFNGDDTLVLRHNGEIVDLLGILGNDPGSQWGNGDASTQNNTMRRRANICAGNINGFANGSDLSAEWVGFANDTFDGLGSHEAACSTTGNAPIILNCDAEITVNQGESNSVLVSANDADSNILSLSVTNVSPNTAGIQMGSLNGNVANLNLANNLTLGSYSVEITATNDAAQTAVCTVTVNVKPAPQMGWIINEFLADPASGLAGDANGDGVRHSSQDEFIELINLTGAARDISGWTIADGAFVRHTFPAGTVIPSRTALILFGGGNPTGAFGGAVVQTASSGAIGLNNSGDSITFASDLGVVQVSVSYGREGGRNQSLNLNTDLQGSAYELHQNLSDAAFSPGTRIDGRPFGGAEELFISEYIEGSSSNKAIEIYNGTGADVVLDNYSIELYSNGATSTGNSLALSDAMPVLANGDVLVIANASAAASILAEADITSTVTYFNGDDTLVLRKDGEIVDMVGILGNDPGSEWGQGNLSTRDNTIRRLPSVCAPTPNGFENGLAAEWVGFPNNSFEDLGRHVAQCGLITNEPIAFECDDFSTNLAAGMIGSRNFSAADPDSSINTFDILSITPAPSQAGLLHIETISMGNQATAVLHIANGLAVGSYEVEVQASNDDAQTAICRFVLNIAPVHSISEIQGSGLESPFDGQAVASMGNVVTAVVSSGFYIQTPDYLVDGDPETSEGLYVFTGTSPVLAVGDVVDVVGQVVEYYGLTELTGGVNYQVVGQAVMMPQPIFLDGNIPSPFLPKPINEMERFEGMLVEVASAFATGPSDRFGDIAINAGGTRVMREPGMINPTLPGIAAFDGNTEVFEIFTGALGETEPVFAGSYIDAMGPLTYSFGDFQLVATRMDVAAPAEYPVPVRERRDLEFTVASLNMYRLFKGEGEAYQTRLVKLSKQITEVLDAPEILATQEVGGLDVLEDLATQIFSDTGIRYTAHLIPGDGFSGVHVGYMVRESIQVTSLVQNLADMTFDLRPDRVIPLFDRPPLLLNAVYEGGHLPFPVSVIVVHNRSFLGSDDPEDGEWVLRKRYLQASAIANLVQDLQTDNPEIRLVITGDFNAFQFTDGFVDSIGIMAGTAVEGESVMPAPQLVNPPLTITTNEVPYYERYSFNYQGDNQALDHMLTSAGLQKFIRGMEFGHANADAPRSFENDPTNAIRATDHDGALLFIESERDSDGDGIADEYDACPFSDMSETIVINGCDTGVANMMTEGGCTLADLLNSCAVGAENHGAFVSCVTQMANDFKKNGWITGKEKGNITACAAKSN